MRLLDTSIVYRHIGRADAAKLLEDPTGKSLAQLEESSRRDPEERKILLEKVVAWRKNCKMLVAVANNAADQHILSLLKWLDLTAQALSGEARRLLDEQIKRGEYEHVVSYLERIEAAVDVLNTSPLRSSRLGRATIIWTPGGVAKSLAASRAVEYRKATPDWKNFYIAAAGVAGFTVGLTFGLECPISKEDAIAFCSIKCLFWTWSCEGPLCKFALGEFFRCLCDWRSGPRIWIWCRRFTWQLPI